jgi:hypothetical protein
MSNNANYDNQYYKSNEYNKPSKYVVKNINKKYRTKSPKIRKVYTEEEKKQRAEIRNAKVDERKNKKLEKTNLHIEYCKEYISKVGLDVRESIANKYKNLKNPIFIANSLDPLTSKYVCSIWLKKISKLDKIIWTMVWEFYRDRKRQSIYDIYKKFPNSELKIIYTGEPLAYFMTTPIKPTEILQNLGIAKESTKKVIEIDKID